MVDQLGHALASWLVPVNVWSAVLLAAALVLDRALERRMRASLRIALYAPVALRVVLPLSWSIPVASMPRAATMALPLDALSGTASGAPGEGTHVVSWYAALGAVYAVVAAALVLRNMLRRRSLARALATATAAPGVEAECAVLRHPELGPMVVGIAPPRIVLPAAMLDGAGTSALACVVAHERAHVRRRDPWLTTAMEALLVVAWPVIPLWLAARRVRHLMELACDEAALDGADAAARRRYGHVLLDVAESGSLPFAAAGALHFGATLRARIEAIALARPWPRAVQASVVSAAVLGFAACSSAGPGTAPQATGGGVRPSAAAGAATADEYGYRFDDDTLREAQAASSAPPVQPINAEGRLAPEAIQTVVRQSFGAYRACYLRGLQKDATLHGTVAVSFIIEPDGSVQNVSDHGSTLPDADVVGCVVGGFSGLTFPPPQGGYVSVLYPLEFSPGD